MGIGHSLTPSDECLVKYKVRTVGRKRSDRGGRKVIGFYLKGKWEGRERGGRNTQQKSVGEENLR